MMMKKILLFLLAAVLVSCSKDKEDPIPSLTLPFEDFYGYQVTDTVGILRETVRISAFTDGITCMSGLKNNKIWLGLYDSVSKKEIQSWIDNSPRDEEITSIRPYSGGLTFDWGYVVSIGVNIPDIFSGSYGSYANYYGAVLILKKAAKEIVTYDFSGTCKELSPFSDNIIVKFYSPALDYNRYTELAIISPNGECLFNSSNYDSLGNCTEISPFSDNIIVKFSHRDEFGHNTDTELAIISPNGKYLFNSISSTSIGDSTLYAGFNQSDHYWFALCDNNNKILKEWNGTDKVERNIKIHLGYGEYLDYYIKDILSESYYSSTGILETAWGYVIQPVYIVNKDATRSFYYTELLLLNDDRVYRVPEDEYVEMRNWYEESFITRKYIAEIMYTVYSPTGDVILTQDSSQPAYSADPLLAGTFTPVSYKSYLHKSVWGWGETADIRLRKYNLNSTTVPLWEHVIKNVPSTTKVEWTLLGKESNIWKYQVDLLNYDGSKEKIVFTVNIDSGDLKIY